MSEVTVLGGQEVVGVGRIEGPILIVEGATNVSYDEVVEIRDSKRPASTGPRARKSERGRRSYRCSPVPPAYPSTERASVFLGILCTCRLRRKCSGASSTVWAIQLMVVRSR